MDFYTVLDQIIDLLRQRGRVSYQALKRQFDIDDAYLEDLKVELIEVQELARDRDGKMLVWSGEAASTPEPTPVPPTHAPVSPASTAHAAPPITHTPPYLAEKILTSRRALEGERKQVTVLFADIKGSTALIEDLDPEEAQRLLDPALHHMMEAVHRYEGTVNQVLGDGIMALFGAPIAHEDHAVRACYAALAMQAAMQHYTAEVRRCHGLAMQMRVGLHAGEVVVRSIGNDLHMDYSAVGQTTHLAARMEQVATPGHILMTAETLRLVDGLVRVESLGPIAIKGVSAPVEVFELTGASTIRRRLQAAAVRGLTRFVGRDAEMVTLTQALEHARAGHGQVVAAVGEAGVGKSRLVYEFIHSYRTQGWLVLESASVSYGKATPYFPVVELLKRYVHATDDDEARTMRAKVTGHILTLDEALQDTLPALLSLLEALPEASPFLQLDPPRRRQRTLEALKRLLLRESQVQPLLLVFEDLHWIDAETQALLDSLVESLPTARLLLLMNYRPEYQHAWGSKTYYTQIRLDPLPPASAEALLEALLGDDPSLAPLKKLLIARTEGNPFFLEETVRTLVETETFMGAAGAYHLAHDLRTIQVPPTVQAVLAARIDRLPQEEKRLLQTAAVIGTEVPLPLLQAIDEFPEAARQHSLTHLQAAEFLYETSLFPERVYTFKHALTHEVAYGSLLQERRRDLHARVVAGLEDLYADRLHEQVERLAQQAFRGEVWEKVMCYAQQAGIRAADRSAYGQAGTFLDQALDALAHLPESQETLVQAFDLHVARANTHAALRELEQRLACCEKISSLAETLGEPHRLALAVGLMGNAWSQIGDNVRALKFAQRGLALAETVGAIDLLVHTRLDMGLLCRTMGDYRRGATVLTQTVELLQGDLARERFGRPMYPAVVAHLHLATCLSALGEFPQALRSVEEGLQVVEALPPQPATRLFAHVSRCEPLLQQGQFHDAVPWLERAMALYTEDLGAWYPMTAGALGFAYAMTGRLAEAMPLLEQAAERAQRVDRRRETQWLTYLSEAYLRAGRQHDSHTVAERLLALGHERSERGTAARGQYLCGEIAAQGEPSHVEVAAAYYREALALADALGMRPLQAHCHCGLGLVYSQTAQAEQARAELHTAIALYREMAMTFWLPQAEAALTQVA